MLKYKILIKLFVLSCMKYNVNSKYNGTTSAWMVSPHTQRINTKLSTNNFINVLYSYTSANE